MKECFTVKYFSLPFALREAAVFHPSRARYLRLFFWDRDEKKKHVEQAVYLTRQENDGIINVRLKSDAPQPSIFFFFFFFFDKSLSQIFSLFLSVVYIRT